MRRGLERVLVGVVFDGEVEYWTKLVSMAMLLYPGRAASNARSLTTLWMHRNRRAVRRRSFLWSLFLARVGYRSEASV